MADGTVKIKVAVDKNEAERQLSGMGNLGSKAIKGLGVVAKATAAAVAAIGVATVKTGAEFESTMSSVEAISGASAEEMERLTEAAKEMGRTSAFSATEAGQAMEYMAMAGWKTEEMTSGLKGIMDLAAASSENLATTSDIVTDALTAFGMSAAESGAFADVLAAASSNANTTVAGLGESFKYVGSVAGALGYDVKDVSVALGLMANSGVKGSQAGTSLRAALTRLSKPTKEMTGYMDALGISLTDQEGNMKPLNQLTGELRTSFAGLSEAEKAQAASALFGKEAMAGMLAVINASDEDFNKLTNAIEGSEGAAARMAEVKLDNLAGQFTLLKSAAEGFLLELYGSGIGSGLTNLVKSGTDAVNKLTTAFQQGGAASLASAGAGMIDKLIAGITSRIPSLTQKASEILSGMMSAVSKGGPILLSRGADLIKSLGEGIGKQLPTLIPKAVSMVVALGQGIVNNIPKIVAAGVSIIKGLGQGIVNALPTLIAEGPRLINDFCSGIMNGIFSLIAAGGQMIINLAKGLWENKGLILQNAGQIFLAILNVFSLSSMLNLGKSLITKAGQGVKTLGPKLVEGLKTVGKNAFNAFKGINWASVGKSVITFIKSAISGAGSGILVALKGAGTAAMNGFKGINWASVGKAAINLIKGAISGAASLVSTALKSVGSKAMSAFKSIDWKSVGTAVINGIKSGLTAAAGKIVDAAKSVAKSALNAARNALGIHSPSRKFRDEVGKMMILGAVDGIEDNEKKLDRAVEDVFGGIMPDIGNIMPMDVGAAITHTVAAEEARAETVEVFRASVADGIADALDGAEVKLDGRSTGKLITPYVDKEMGRRAG